MCIVCFSSYLHLDMQVGWKVRSYKWDLKDLCLNAETVENWVCCFFLVIRYDWFLNSTLSKLTVCGPPLIFITFFKHLILNLFALWCIECLFSAAIDGMRTASCCDLTMARITQEGHKPGALWHIFDAKDSDKIRDLLTKVHFSLLL